MTKKEVRVNKRLRAAADRKMSTTWTDPRSGKTRPCTRSERQAREAQAEAVSKKKASRRQQAKRSPWQRQTAREAFALKVREHGNMIINGKVVSTQQVYSETKS
jgi:hypothetical protein